MSQNKIFKSLVSKQHHIENGFVYIAAKTWNDIQKEMKGVMLNTFEFYLNIYETSQILLLLVILSLLLPF